MKVVVVADGSVGPRAAARVLASAPAAPASLVIAADGGARKAADLGRVPDVVIGDGDSLAPAEQAELRRLGAEVLLFPAEKDESDTELALREAIARGGDEIVVLGALHGRRFDHAIANVTLLALRELEGRDVRLVDDDVTVRLVGRFDGPDEATISGRPGDLVSLLPIDASVDGIVTSGLRYRLQGEALRIGPSRGLSNEMTAPRARVRTARGRLLIVHTDVPPDQGGGDQDDR